MTNITAQFIKAIVSLFEWTYFICGCVVILVCVDWVGIEAERKAWRESNE